MEPSDYGRALKRSWPALLVLSMLGAGAGAAYSATEPDQYRATSSVFVSASDIGTTQDLLDGSRLAQEAVQSFVQLATLPAVLEPVDRELRLRSSASRLAKTVEVTAPLDTTVIQIAATRPTAGEAAAVAQAVARSLIVESKGLIPRYKGRVALAMRLVGDARPPRAPTGPGAAITGLIGAAIGLVLAVLYALARSIAPTRIRSEEDLAQLSDLPVLGGLSRTRSWAGGPIGLRPNADESEEYRRLRTNVQFVGLERQVKVLAVTSSAPGEGKSTVAANLAVALAEQGGRVLLLDGDLRRSAIAAYTGLEGSLGLSTVLAGRSTGCDATQDWGDSGVEVLPAGDPPPNPAQLLASSAMASLLDELRDQYDVIVIDAPPLLAVSDGLTLAGLADAAVIVVRHGATRSTDVDQTLESLGLARVPTLGFVLNAVPTHARASSQATGTRAPTMRPLGARR